MNPLLDMLGAVGNVVDTPASVVRGLISGNPSRAFGGIMDSSQRVYGSELTGDPYSGFAVDVLADPLNLIGGVGLLKGMKAAKLAKATNARRAELLASGGMPEEIAKLTKIVDESGKPLRTYHGTGAVYDKFDPSKVHKGLLHGPGYYTTASGPMASTYAENVLASASPTPTASAKEIADAYRSRILSQPDVDPRMESWMKMAHDDEIVNEAAQHLASPWSGGDSTELGKTLEPMFRWEAPTANVRMQYIDARNPLDLDSGIGAAMRGKSKLAEQFPQMAKDAGYDALTHTGGKVTGGTPHKVVIALDPSQIYSPWIAPAAQQVPRQSPLLAALSGHNVLARSNRM